MMKRQLSAAIAKVTALHSGFLKVHRYEFAIDNHDGGSRTSIWEVMDRGNAVAVLGYDPERDMVVLVNEFRPGALIAGDYPFTDNLVAGGIGPGESAIEAAVREMKEEAGLELRDPQIIHPGAYVSSGGSSEKIAIVIGSVDASRAGGIHGNPNESEDILTVVLPAEEFIRRVRGAQIADLKTLVAGYWLAEDRERRNRSASQGKHE